MSVPAGGWLGPASRIPAALRGSVKGVGLAVPGGTAAPEAPAGTAGTAQDGRAASPTGRPWSRSGGWADVGLLVPLLALAVVARRPGYLLSHAFWLDEAWVADSVRAPLRQLGLLSSSTPIGWTLLLRLVPDIGPPERLRLLPLAFGVASVVAAYLLGRRLGRVPAVAAGLAAALAPGMLRNHSLKQYSADVFVTLGLFWLGARLAAGWSRRLLAALCLACIPAVLVSHITVFVSMAVLGALSLWALAERRWDRLAWLAPLGAAVAGAQAAAYLAFATNGDNAAMQRVWAASFIPGDGGAEAAVSFVAARATDALDRVGFGPWPLATAIVVCGMVAFWRARLPVVPLAVGLLAVQLVVAGALNRYPFLDDRTSLFFTTLLTVCGAIGVGSVAAWSARRPLTVPVGIAVAAGACALLVPAARANAMQSMPASTTRQQVQYVLAHRQPGDAIVVGAAASFGFGYYWPERPTFTPATTGTAVRFQVDYPGRDDLVLVHRRLEPAAIVDGVRQAAARSRSGRVWVVLAEAGDRSPAWKQAMTDVGRVVRPALPKLVEVRQPGD
jgi:hypothetical protein